MPQLRSAAVDPSSETAPDWPEEQLSSTQLVRTDWVSIWRGRSNHCQSFRNRDGIAQGRSAAISCSATNDAKRSTDQPLRMTRSSNSSGDE